MRSVTVACAMCFSIDQVSCCVLNKIDMKADVYLIEYTTQHIHRGRCICTQICVLDTLVLLLLDMVDWKEGDMQFVNIKSEQRKARTSKRAAFM